MENWKFISLFLVFIAFNKGVEGLKDVSAIVPQAVSVGDTVTLQCHYDLENEDLYMVKWYKGTKEFYRYIPKELPSTLLFPLQGIDVDLSQSSPNEVVLRNVQKEITGKYTCEVSSDAPNFYTHLVFGYMFVVDVPDENPELYVEKDVIEVGNTLRANCTAPASYPPANLTLYLNGKRVNETSSARTPKRGEGVGGKRRPLVTTVGLEVEVEAGMFHNGKARLSCVGNIFQLYRREVEQVLEEDRPKPRPSSVLGTRDAVSGAPMLLGLVLGPCLFLVAVLR